MSFISLEMFTLRCSQVWPSQLGSFSCAFTASPRSRGELDETWCSIMLITFVLDHLVSVAPVWCNSASPTCLLGCFTTGLGKSNSTILSRIATDEVLNFFSALMFTFECSRITMPRRHGFALWNKGSMAFRGAVTVLG